MTSPLSETETSLVIHLADGKTVKEISQETGLSKSYVDFQIKLARRVADVGNCTGLVAKALRQGWIT